MKLNEIEVKGVDVFEDEMVEIEGKLDEVEGDEERVKVDEIEDRDEDELDGVVEFEVEDDEVE